jgi:catechol 2,3-dioxygenase-like lactoylglutathione lyase family enzyme
VKDVDATSKRIAQVSQIGAPQTIGADIYRAGLDADKNFFAIRELNFETDSNAAPTIDGFPTQTPIAETAQRVMHAWLAMDGEKLTKLYSPKGTWFDDTRLKQRGLERGAGIEQALENVYWSHYDYSEQGMTAHLEASNVHTRPFGAQTIVSYNMQLSGRGPHPFRDSAWVTQVFDQENQVVHTFIVDNNRSTAPVLELDYTGYPVQNMEKARQFYAKTIRFGEGYPDEKYYGFWSNHAVFGLYEADPDEDDLPEPRRANGYMSFWVRSANETYEYLKQQGRNFPTIPAINDKVGIDKQRGYSQVVTTDSEDNLIIFTEYSGRRR